MEIEATTSEISNDVIEVTHIDEFWACTWIKGETVLNTVTKEDSPIPANNKVYCSKNIADMFGATSYQDLVSGVNSRGLTFPS